MKYIIVFYLLIFISDVFSQVNKVDSLGLRQGEWHIEGGYDSTLMTTENLTICNFKNDTLHGEYRVFDSNGTLRKHSYHINGKTEGNAFLYSKKGILINIFYFVNEIAIKEFYYTNGRLFSVKSYNKDMEKHGLNIDFWKNGRAKYKRYYKNGNEIEYKSHYRNGNVKLHITYSEEGKLIEHKKYNRWGKLKRRITKD